ncbi:unnamed protein product [Peronospora belbahrii]|uniref:DUF1764 domain-containing protein n=1 Tax=Peronospora belbahrii TaxID=622444 RepID=A0AAU9LFC1_9STRA|nr:unnamed protein product [Peronospora belbahrii]
MLVLCRRGQIEEKPAVSVQLNETSNEQFKFSKPLMDDAAAVLPPTNDVNVEEESVQMKGIVSMDVVAVDRRRKKKSKKKKKTKRSGGSNVAIPEIATRDENKAEGNEIDDLFASLKTKKQKKNIEMEQQKLAEEEEKRRGKKEKEQLQQQIKKLEAQNTNSSAVGLNPDPRPVRYDEDGLPIYTETSLQIGKGGNTTDCPFDCWCCF